LMVVAGLPSPPSDHPSLYLQTIDCSLNLAWNLFSYLAQILLYSTTLPAGRGRRRFSIKWNSLLWMNWRWKKWRSFPIRHNFNR